MFLTNSRPSLVLRVRSTTATSGEEAAMAPIASGASSTCAQTARSGCCATSWVMPRRTTAWSSTSRTFALGSPGCDGLSGGFDFLFTRRVRNCGKGNLFTQFCERHLQFEEWRVTDIDELPRGFLPPIGCLVADRHCCAGRRREWQAPSTSSEQPALLSLSRQTNRADYFRRTLRSGAQSRFQLREVS